MCGGIYKGRMAPVHANRSMAMYDQSLVNQYLDTSMALIGANASAIFAANNNNNIAGQQPQQTATVGFIHPLIYQKRVSIINPDDSTAQLLLIPAAARTSCGGGIELTKLAAANNNPNNPNQVYDDISEAFDVNNKSTAALINNSSSSKVNEYCYIPANGLVASYMPPPASKPIQIVRY